MPVLPEDVRALDLRAMVRLALRAHGFRLSAEELERAMAARFERGRRFRDETLPSMLPPFVDRARYDAGVRREPALRHFPHMLGFGLEQADALRGDAPLDPLAAGACAAFSAGIALIDYVADELLDVHGLFAQLDPAVQALFAPGGEADRALAEAAARAADPKREVLFALVGVCRHAFLQLHARGGNTAALRALAAVIGEMYAAERRLAHGGGGTADAEAKSVLPFVAVARILALAAPVDAESDARTLGRIVMLADDLVDLKEDCARGTPTIAVSALASMPEVAGAGVFATIDRLAGELVALLPARGALADLARTTVGGWVGWRDDAPQPRAERSDDPALAALLHAQRTGYREAMHHLSLPRLGSSVEVQPALTFQRAIVLDALLDAGAPEDVLAAEAMRLLAAKHRRSRGGWNYIPQVEELPPDADDLACVLLALYRTGGSAVAAVCDPAIRLANAAGDFSTWIVDDASVLAPRMRAYIELTQSGGAHPEVVAHFLYALAVYDRDRYADVLRRGSAWLARAQEADGSWTSRWYAGPYYGTFRALLALTTIGVEDDAVARGARFLEAKREGWMREPLQTAFALLALIAAGRGEGIEEAVQSLRRAQREDGTWPESPFITFPLPGTVRTSEYASRTITTAFCLKALLTAASAAVPHPSLPFVCRT